jgi:hypothetical protein
MPLDDHEGVGPAIALVAAVTANEWARVERATKWSTT